jgi:glycosyltransferase involved in cell wall biosynthesis
MHHHIDGDRLCESTRAARITGLVAVSELVREQYLDHNPAFAPERLIVIPNAVDDRRRLPPSRLAARVRLGLRDEMLFVSLARHCTQKNTYGLVDAFGKVAAARPDVHLLIAGRPDNPGYFAQVQRLRSRLSHADRVHLRDHSPDPAALLAAADAFVLDSFFEGWALASMEALYCGLPIVVSDVGGAREQVGDDGRQGILVTNPLGHPGMPDWETMRRRAFEPQPNRAELVAAMLEVADRRDEWAARRPALRRESIARFDAAACLGAHARALDAASRGVPIGSESALGAAGSR